jgi:hypothetical protein
MCVGDHHAERAARGGCDFEQLASCDRQRPSGEGTPRNVLLEKQLLLLCVKLEQGTPRNVLLEKQLMRLCIKLKQLRKAFSR